MRRRAGLRRSALQAAQPGLTEHRENPPRTGSQGRSGLRLSAPTLRPAPLLGSGSSSGARAVSGGAVWPHRSVRLVALVLRLGSSGGRRRLEWQPRHAGVACAEQLEPSAHQSVARFAGNRCHAAAVSSRSASASPYLRRAFAGVQPRAPTPSVTFDSRSQRLICGQVFPPARIWPIRSTI